ncbi:AraC family transcriptional regulator [Rhizobium sp. LjRoot254]|uniref:AraC family transcriptional regulator n=1 Tax=Rhizobium sp. LjRoot254 TaxID=3342297 RepID=UPI003ECF59EC
MVTNHDGPIIRKLAAVPTATGLAARLGVAHLERSGINPAPLLSRSGLSKADLSNHTRISVLSQIELLGQISLATKDAWTGLTLAQDFDLREIGMLYYVAASSQTLGDALRRIERYARVGNEALTVQVEKTSACRIRLSYTGVPRHLDRHQMECFVFALLRVCRQITGKKLAPIKASFVHHRSGNLDKMRRLFGCDIEFDAYADEMHFDPTVLALPLVNADPFLNEIMTQMSEEALSVRTTNTSPFRTLVENTIAPLLPHAEASARVVSRRLGMSERTFARRLAEEDLSFGEILNQMRRDMAIRYLEEDNLQASQIAWLLGFHQSSSFSHACRRWTGKSPSEFRLR